MPKSPDESPEDQNALIAQMYELAINPSAFETLVSLSDMAVRAIKDPLDQEERPDNDLDEHARRADAILSRLGAEQPAVAPTSVADAIVEDPCPVIVLSWDARVVTTSRAFGEAFGTFAAPSEAEAFLAAASFPGEWEKLRAALAAARPQNKQVLGALQVEIPGLTKRMLFILHQMQCPEDSRVGAILCGLSPKMSGDAGAAVKQHFGLTEAELDIVRRLIGGDGVREIATARGTSLQTVRTQTKLLLQKTGFGSQIELIRQLGSFRTIPSVSNAAPNGLAAPGGGWGADVRSVMQSVELVSGARLDYALIGPEDGKLVLFIHGLVDSVKMNAGIRALLQGRGIRLLAPVRPHFGASSGYDSGEDPGRAFGDRLAELFDMLCLAEPLPVIGHMAGAFYAYRLAIDHPEKVSHIVSVAGAVPMAESWQFEGMSKGHRIAGLTARRAPSLLRLLTRGGIAFLQSNREDYLLKLAFHDSSFDLAFAETEEMRALVLDRFRFMTAQGHQAFEVDLKLVSSDWSHLIKQIAKPVALVHGAHDRVVLSKGVEIFARQIAAPLRMCPSSGQLVWSTSPHLAFDMLDALAPVNAV